MIRSLCFFFLSICKGLNNFNKAAKDLLQSIQKIDNDNYPEVHFYAFSSSLSC